MQQNYKYSLVGHFLYRQLAPSVGKTLYVQHFFGNRMAHSSATPAVAGSGDTIRFGSMEFPALSPAGMRVPPVFEPSQAFCFGGLDFVADRLAYSTSARRRTFQHPSRERPPSTPGRATSKA